MQIDPRDWLRSIDWTTMIDWSELVSRSGEILVILALAWISHRVLRLLLRRIEQAALATEPGTLSAQERRIATLISLVRSVGLAVIGTITLFMVLTALGIQIGPLLAGAGIIGLAISFGAQSLVRDILSGLFILFENQFGVGDVIRLDDISGTVERMTLRIVVLRDVHGIVHIVPNGEITRVSNLTRSFSRAVLDINVPYKEDAEHVMRAMQDEGLSLWNDPTWRPILMEEPVVPGIEAFGDTTFQVRMLATTLPLKQWDVGRELRRRLKQRFDREGIEMPTPYTTLYWGEDQKPNTGDGTGEPEATRQNAGGEL